MVRRIVTSIGFLLLLASGAHAGPAEDCTKHEDAGRQIRGCTQVIETAQDAKNLAAAYYMRGVAYFRRNSNDRAIADFRKAIEINPRLPQAYNGLGVVYSAKKDHDRAIDHFSKAIRIQPKFGPAYMGRGNAYQNKYATDERAIADCTKATEMNPKDAGAYNCRAWGYLKTGRAGQGLTDAEKSLVLRPNDARTLDTRGHIFEALGKRDEAIADFRRSLSLAPNDPEVQASGKEALKRMGTNP